MIHSRERGRPRGVQKALLRESSDLRYFIELFSSSPLHYQYSHFHRVSHKFAIALIAFLHYWWADNMPAFKHFECYTTKWLSHHPITIQLCLHFLLRRMHVYGWVLRATNTTIYSLHRIRETLIRGALEIFVRLR